MGEDKASYIVRLQETLRYPRRIEWIDYCTKRTTAMFCSQFVLTCTRCVWDPVSSGIFKVCVAMNKRFLVIVNHTAIKY